MIQKSEYGFDLLDARAKRFLRGLQVGRQRPPFCFCNFISLKS